jgi:hypothetical protein
MFRSVIFFLPQLRGIYSLGSVIVDSTYWTTEVKKLDYKIYISCPLIGISFFFLVQLTRFPLQQNGRKFSFQNIVLYFLAYLPYFEKVKGGS